MPELSITAENCLWNEGTVLLDFRDLLGNKSRVSMHRTAGWDIPTLPDLLAGLAGKAQAYESDLALHASLAAVLCAERLRRSARPVRALEYGCGDGWLSRILAELLGAFHGENLLVCAYDGLDERSFAWAERLAEVPKPPHINYLAGDYGALTLPERAFDLVLINGAAAFPDQEAVVRDALRLASESGLILCCAQDETLWNSFSARFPRRAEYVFLPGRQGLLAAEARAVLLPPEPDEAGEDRACLERADALLAEGSADRAALLSAEAALLRSARRAGLRGDVPLKLALLETKERLIEKLIG